MNAQGKCLAGLVMLSLSTDAFAADGPLQIAKQGSLEIGGEFVDCATNDGGDPIRDLLPVSVVCDLPPLLLVRADSRFASLRDLLNEARSAPGLPRSWC